MTEAARETARPRPVRRPPPRYPLLYEINARTWLSRLSRAAGAPLSLADIDDAALDDLQRQGFDWLWLMGVWPTGAASRALSRRDPDWRAEFQAALPDLVDDDIAGSAYAIGGYGVDPALGGAAALAALRARLAARGLRLMLDFVPNHTALDHPWVAAHPDYYVAGSAEALAASPDAYCRVATGSGERILAHGRDPNFSPWRDTLQLDYANPAVQAAQIATLEAIAGLCDGVRCDMAMLLLPEIFGRTWRVTPAPFWPAAIAAARRVRPGFVFLAEAYWDLEWQLQQQGFDYCYDKRLYDRLRAGTAGAVRAHLSAGLDYQDRLARFLENHDEPRAATSLPWPLHQAAAIVTYLSPGLRFFHQGQLDGARIRVPVHLRRAPVEPANAEIAAFYDRLLATLVEAGCFRDGAWLPIAPQPAWAGNPTWQDFIGCAWRGPGGTRAVVAVNFADRQGQCLLRVPFADLAGARLRLSDLMGAEIYERAGDALRDPGLYVDLGPWRYNVFRLEALA
jgi:hypothetical protein